MDTVVNLFLLFAVAPSLVVAEDIWVVHLAYGPAPPPDKRPTFSRNATLDPSNLKYQIPAIIGSYIIVVGIIGISIITFGRRMRRDAQTGRAPKSLEMVKPSNKSFEPSPSSPQNSANLWGRWGSPRIGSMKGKSSYNDKKVAPGIVSFDANVIEHDRAQRQDEMERIYAELMAQETKAPKSVNVKEFEIYPEDKAAAPSSSKTHDRKISFDQGSVAHMQQAPRYSDETGAYQPAHPPPGTAQSLYPPHAMMPSDANAAVTMAPGGFGYYPSAELMSSPPPIPPPSARPLGPTHSRQTPPPYSHARQVSGASISSKKSGRRSIRDLQISNPIPVAQTQDEPLPQHPLSPRAPKWYTSPGRPPTPPTAMERPSTPFEDDSDTEIDNMRSPKTPRGKFRHNVRDEAHNSSDDEIHTDDDEDGNRETESIIQAYGYRNLNSPKPPPNAAPQRQTGRTTPPLNTIDSRANLISPGSNAGAQAQPVSRTATPGNISRSNTPGALSLGSQSKTAAGSSTNTLPFRAFHPPPMSPTNQTLSPGATKTTFLSPRRDRFMPGGMHAIGPHGIVPNTAALLSAGLATPYSPYMPFSPMTPVTPHLVSRRERREMERDRPRLAVTEEDVVEDEKDMWGDGWD